MPVLSNHKHELFAQGLAEGKTADEAYIAAGFKENRGNASRLKANENIVARVAEILGASAERVEVDAAYVLSTIIDTVERCKQAKQVFDRKGEAVLVETPEGELAPAYVFDSKAVLRGAELLGKHLGMFTEKHEHTGKDGGPIETIEKSDRELAKGIAFLLAKAARKAE